MGSSNWAGGQPRRARWMGAWRGEENDDRSPAPAFGGRLPPPDDAGRADLPSEPIPLTVYGIREPTPGPRWQALFAATWSGYRQWYLQRDVRPRPDLRARAAHARHAHARVGPDLRADGRAGRTDRCRRGRGPVADAVGSAALPARVLAGGADRAADRAVPELRLLPRSLGAGGLFQRLPRAAGDRQQRLPVGPAGRDERRRPGGVAQLRRPPRVRARASPCRWSSATCWRWRPRSTRPGRSWSACRWR